MPSVSDHFTISELRRLFDLNKDIGLFWRVREELRREDKIFNKQFAGRRAGNINKKSGYAQITMRLNGRKFVFKEHRLILCMVIGEIIGDDVQVDHIDLNRSNNAVINLRIATSSQNNFNQGLRVDNTSGSNGVCYANYAQKWRAIIRANGKSKHLGYFYRKEDAERAYQSAADVLHGKFARLS